MRNLRSGIAISLLALVAACAKHPAAATTPSGGAGGGAAAAPVTLVRLENGDRACYVIYKGADGEEKSQEGSFDLCEGGSQDATALIGKQVTFTTAQGKVQAASCEGNPECSDSDVVELVMSITAAP